MEYDEVFDADYIRAELARLKEEDKKYTLSKQVPSLFVTQGDRADTFVVQINNQWSKDKYPRELLPAVRAYKTALIKELRNAEWAIEYLQSEGLYPLDELTIKVKWESRNADDL